MVWTRRDGSPIRWPAYQTTRSPAWMICCRGIGQTTRPDRTLTSMWKGGLSVVQKAARRPKNHFNIRASPANYRPDGRRTTNELAIKPDPISSGLPMPLRDCVKPDRAIAIDIRLEEGLHPLDIADRETPGPVPRTVRRP